MIGLASICGASFVFMTAEDPQKARRGKAVGKARLHRNGGAGVVLRF